MPQTLGPFYPRAVAEIHDGENYISLDHLDNLISGNGQYASHEEGGAGTIACDKSVRLAIDGEVAGDEKGSSDLICGYGVTEDVEADYGGDTDLWGLPLTPEIVNGEGFGVGIQLGIGAGSWLNTFIMHDFRPQIDAEALIVGVKIVPRWLSTVGGVPDTEIGTPEIVRVRSVALFVTVE